MAPQSWLRLLTATVIHKCDQKWMSTLKMYKMCDTADYLLRCSMLEGNLKVHLCKTRVQVLHRNIQDSHKVSSRYRQVMWSGTWLKASEAGIQGCDIRLCRGPDRWALCATLSTGKTSASVTCGGIVTRSSAHVLMCAVLLDSVRYLAKTVILQLQWLGFSISLSLLSSVLAVLCSHVFSLPVPLPTCGEKQLKPQSLISLLTLPGICPFWL